MKKLFVFLIMLMLVSFAQDGFAQKKRKRTKKSKHPVTVELADGTKISGMLDRMSADTLYMKNETLGALKFALSDVSYTSDAKNETGSSSEHGIAGVNEYKINYDQYMFSASAFNIEESYYANRDVLFHTVGYRVNKNVSIYATIEPILSIWSKTLNLGIGCKVSTPIKDNFRVAFGTNISTTGGFHFVMPYGVMTFGSKRSNFSINGRYLFFLNSEADGGVFVAGASGGHQFNKRFSIMGEFYVALGEEFNSAPLYGVAVRRHGKYSGSAFDFGVYVQPLLGVTLPIPYLAYSTPLR